MTNTLYCQPATGFIAAGEPGNLTELVRGQERLFLDRITPLVRRQSLALDLSSVQRIDAAGIAALITLYRTASEAGHRFSVSHASPRVAAILALVGLDRILLSQNAVQTSYFEPRLRQTAA